jgi:branched-chain amino acid transport system substrate-binding protein
VDKVDFFLGPASSPITIKASTVAEKYGIPMVAVEANSPPIFNRGFKWLVGVLQPASEWAQEYYTMLKFLMDKGDLPRLKTVAVIQEDTPHTKDVGWGARHLAGIAGLQVVAFETVPGGAKDFSAVISKLKGLNPDVLYVSTWATTGLAVAQQAHDLGLRPVDLHIIHATNQVEFAAKAGKGISDRITGISYAAPFKRGDVELWNELLKRTGLGPYDWGAGAIRFVATEALLKGIQAAGTLDRARVMEALRQLRYESLFGPMSFRFGVQTAGTKVDGVGNQIVFHAQWQDGKIQILWPPEMATARYAPYRPR